MKKHLLALFAASALFAACSSDEMPNNPQENNGDNGQTTVIDENLPSSVAMTTEEGVGMSVGALDEAADTKASGNEVYFDIQPYTDNILAQFEGYIMKADDFAIRVNGDPLHVTPIKGENGVTKQKFKITRDQELKVRVEGLESLTYNPNYDDVYSFECWLWVENKKQKQKEENGVLLDEYEELFSFEDKLNWIGGEENLENSGVDVTLKAIIGLHDKSVTEPEEGQPEFGYKVSYNVYRGISGRAVNEDGEFDKDGLGDTPYIKVSVNVIRLADDEKTEVGASIPKN
ncbi:MAG TPA: hypothetical protein H9785_00470 [Candidatus Bacteroides intestinavium]|uniref:Lipoprotein n=1 Tax=Candidatus Bacteroides intestinavium TaxID=2838469 RepID=A0A9D2HQA8_9BACE|nr:hypothetical protein [Candidatus Bacteroides intestinavium]